MRDVKKVEMGKTFGRWTVIGEGSGKNNPRRWLCRCACGTEREVLERSLVYGSSQSCGCLRIEKTGEALAHDLTGKTFGELTVLHRAENQRHYGGVWWTCRCSCGELYDTTGTLLVNGRRARCSGPAHEKNYASADIAGQRFHRLVAVKPLPKRDARYSVIWLCRCDCGNEVELPYNTLVYSNVQSCGCRKKEHNAELKDKLTHVAGTSLDILKSTKVPENNTSGAKGVYWIRGRWVAKIVFQKKAYYLGTFDKFEEAVAARKQAEDMINRGTVAHYDRWKAKAEADPAWGEANPMEIRVSRNVNHELVVDFLPELGEEGM